MLSEPTGNCPSCSKPVSKAPLVKIDTDIFSTKLNGPLPVFGLGYACPHCSVLLPVWPQETGTKR